MNVQKIKIIFGSVFAIATVWFSVVRVQPYFHDARGLKLSSSQKQTNRVVINASVPNYNVTKLKEGAGDLLLALVENTRSALLNLSSDFAPSDRDASQIANVYGKYVLMNRLGSYQDKLSYYQERNIQPYPVLVRKNVENSKEMWAYSTSWARHSSIDPDQIRVVPRFVLGKQSSSPRAEGATTYTRFLSTGGKLLQNAESFTVYGMILNVFVPNLDGKSEFTVDVCISIINDGPGGEWSVISTTWSNKPQGKVFVLPYP